MANTLSVSGGKQHIERFGILSRIKFQCALVNSAHPSGAELVTVDDDGGAIEGNVRHWLAVAFQRSDVPGAL
jgi:hypothetical protein